MKWTISKACVEWNVHPKTLKQGLVGRGLTIVKGATFTTLEICAAIYGDLDYERTLETRARREAQEMENAKSTGELVSMSEVESLYTEALLPVRQRLTALPSECCTRANPTDPQHARASLQQWVDEALPLIREQLPKVKK